MHRGNGFVGRPFLCVEYEPQGQSTHSYTFEKEMWYMFRRGSLWQFHWNGLGILTSLTLCDGSVLQGRAWSHSTTTPEYLEVHIVQKCKTVHDFFWNAKAIVAVQNPRKHQIMLCCKNWRLNENTQAILSLFSGNDAVHFVCTSNKTKLPSATSNWSTTAQTKWRLLV